MFSTPAKTALQLCAPEVGSVHKFVRGLVILAQLLALQVWAAGDVERQKAAEEITLAKEAATRQQFRLALDHALGAWQLDASNASYLLDAAAYAVAAGMDDRGHDLAKEWLSLAHRDRAHDARARQLLATVGRRKAAALAKEAAEASKAGDHAGARQRFLAAAKADPGEVEYLFAAAMEAEAVGDRLASKRLAADYVKIAGSDAPNLPRAKRMAEEPGDIAVAAQPTLEARPDDANGNRRLALGLAISGGVVLLGGAALLTWGAGEASLADSYKTTPAMTYAEFQQHDSNATLGIRLGLGAAGVGLACATAGGWLWWRGERGVAAIGPVVSPTGLQIVGRF